jgi:hypothetical protein
MGEKYRQAGREDPPWEDVATVTVPAKTKRKTVIEKAARDLDFEGEIYLRVIPAEHAVPIKVEMEQPPPQLKIG